MARTALTAKQLLGSLPSLPLAADSADFSFAAGDNSNGNKVTMTGQDILLVFNSAGAPGTVTISSVALSGRTGDITAYSVGAGEYAAFGEFNVPGWAQSDGSLYIDVSASTMKLAVLRR